MSPTTVYVGMPTAGVFKSTDGGNHWVAVNVGLTNTAVQALAIDPLNHLTVYAGTAGGVFKSLDGGRDWMAINDGLTNTLIRALVLDAAVPTTVYAATVGGGVFVLRQ